MKERGLKTFEKNGVKITLVEPSKIITETIVDINKMDKAIVEEYEDESKRFETIKSKYDEEALKYTTTNITKVPQTAYLKITIKEK